ncbi:MAG: hypothetical protein IPI67_25895 [Myxococcales bacterium]|nr:hypothetical protein [Myxococcales bacterium]
MQDESGWRSEAVELERDAIVSGIARRSHALLTVMRPKTWSVHAFNGRSWRRTLLPAGFLHAWMSKFGIVLGYSIPPIVLGVNTSAPCELVARIENQSTTYIPLPIEFRPNAIVGLRESDLWFTGHRTTFHWDGVTWREAAPELGSVGAVVDEDGALWFVGARSATGWPHTALYRVRRK